MQRGKKQSDSQRILEKQSEINKMYIIIACSVNMSSKNLPIEM